MKSIAYFFIVFLSVMSCGDSKTEAPKPNETPQKAPKNLIIDFSFKTSEADEFKIMMNNIQVDELQTKNIQIVENVIQSTGFDKIIANFGSNNLSKQVVIHLGSKIEKEVTINGILISYGNKQFNLTSPEDLNSNLVFNKFIVRDSVTNRLTTKQIDGKLNPTIRIKNSLINQLERE